MIQENKELLLQDLCARIPYGVKCVFGVDDAIYEICGINPTRCGASEIQATHIKSGINGDFTLNACKPYLFPLSSMTKEQYNEWCDLGEKPLDDILTKNANGEKISTLEHHLLVAKSSIDSVNYCYKNHFDIYGLIPIGLAIDATNLNIY